MKKIDELRKKIGEDFSIKSKEDIDKIITFNKKTSLLPAEHLCLLETVRATKKKTWLWEVMLASSDIYSVTTMLETLDKDWLDIENLFSLTKSNDMALRRAVMRAFGRYGKDESAAKRLEKYLGTQKDEPLLGLGNIALDILKGELPPKPNEEMYQECEKRWKASQKKNRRGNTKTE